MNQNQPAPTRRALAAGALWSVPVVALATSSPAFAASTDPVSFVRGSFTAAGNTVVSDLEIRVHPATAGVVVTLRFSYGDARFTSNNEATATVTTEANGRAYVPAFRIPEMGGASYLSA